MYEASSPDEAALVSECFVHVCWSNHRFFFFFFLAGGSGASVWLSFRQAHAQVDYNRRALSIRAHVSTCACGCALKCTISCAGRRRWLV